MNAQAEKTLLEKLKTLPPARLAEVEDFIDFLKGREERTRDEAARRLGEAFEKLDALSAPPMTSAEVLTRRLAAIGKTARDVLADYLEAIELVEPVAVPRVVRDPDDDHVLACALAAAAELVVSGDPDLLELTDYEGTPIVTPAEALRRVEARK